MNFLDVDWLKKNHKMIHYFGLGFIQLKIDERFRMHFYTPELPPIVPEEDIHNHRYDFESNILKGEFHQKTYEVVEGDRYILEQESCQEGQHSDVPGKPVGIRLASWHTYSAPAKYFVSHATFHQVRASNCITLLARSRYATDLAEVIRPVGAKKVCPFSQKVPEEQLWGIVERMLKE